jgi:hypothetical protein
MMRLRAERAPDPPTGSLVSRKRILPSPSARRVFEHQRTRRAFRSRRKAGTPNSDRASLAKRRRIASNRQHHEARDRRRQRSDRQPLPRTTTPIPREYRRWEADIRLVAPARPRFPWRLHPESPSSHAPSTWTVLRWRSSFQTRGFISSTAPPAPARRPCPR